MSVIEIDPDRMCGQPCLKGRRLTIEHLVRNIFAGMTVDEYCNDYQVEKELVLEVLKEIADNIGEWIENDDKY